MVATWNPAASSRYYTRQTEYYLGGTEPDGVWYAPARDFALVDGSLVERKTFERLYDAIGEDGRPLLDRVRRHKERTPAFDVTLSAPRSVSLAWAFGSHATKQAIEAAQHRAVRATLAMLEREATWARRARGGLFLEQVGLSAACFRHGESRRAEHIDGRIFADANLHTHCVCLNLATRPDFSIGGLHSKVIRDFKMAAGAVYHAALAHELEKIGFAIDRVGRNGVFEIVGVDDATIGYFSARRQEIEDELALHGVTSAEATALAAAISKATRGAKLTGETLKREEVWADAARSLGIDVENFTEKLRDQAHVLDREAAEQILAERLAALPRALTEHESVIERRELIRSVAAALVGTGLSSERVSREADRLLRDGAILEIGQDALGLPCYSTPEMLAIERAVVASAQTLASRPWHAIDRGKMETRCMAAGLSAEQTGAVLTACDNSAIAIIEGAPGSGKTTTLASVVEAYRVIGCTVLATATAWRIATMLRDDLGVEARATASWIAKIDAGEKVLDERTVLIADEAGLLSSRDMRALLGAVAKAGAKLVLVGDRQQLQPIGAGAGLTLVTRAIEAAVVEEIVRQKEPWLREAIADFGAGRAATALQVFAARSLLVEAQGAKAAIAAIIDAADQARSPDQNASILILAKSNAAVAAISGEARGRLKAVGLIRGKEISFTAATPSGHATEIRLARGDRVRFLVRDDDLGVINGTTATVTKVSELRSLTSGGSSIRIEADISGQRVTFDPMQLADAKGRPRLGWAYAATIHGSQGLTVDRAVVYVDPSLNRHDIYVAASRARQQTTLVVDAKGIDRRLMSELPIDRQSDDLVFSGVQRRTWLAERLSRAAPKISTLDVIEASHPREWQAQRTPERRREELSYEL
ncbi:MAG: relaxase domain-containing protein [Xanthobacteraceae bacterium]|nr:relaxase domain-containing protein [Xanthobacteraceae bacterium]